MIFLVRHGEAASGWGDHPDPGLSELGHRQAGDVARTLSALSARFIVSSPMQRCRETAAPFEAMRGVNALIAPAVSEISTPLSIEDRPAWLRGIMSGTWAEAGEIYVAWRRDMAAFVESLEDQTVVFSHFVAINALVGFASGDDRVTVFRPAHASVTALERREGGGLTVVRLGEERASIVL